MQLYNYRNNVHDIEHTDDNHDSVLLMLAQVVSIIVGGHYEILVLAFI